MLTAARVVVDIVDAAKHFCVGIVWGEDREDKGCDHRKYDDRVHVGADEGCLRSQLHNLSISPSVFLARSTNAHLAMQLVESM